MEEAPDGPMPVVDTMHIILLDMMRSKIVSEGGAVANGSQ